MLPLYDRMPVILPAAEYDQWLDCQRQDAEPLHAILRPYPGDDLLAYPVSTRVNNPANETLECLAPGTLKRSEAGKRARRCGGQSAGDRTGAVVSAISCATATGVIAVDSS
jgi:hypothetical protein